MKTRKFLRGNKVVTIEDYQWFDRSDFDITKIKGYKPNEEIYGHIYITFFPDGRVYVGQCVREINSNREKEYFGSGTHFKRAQRKYGKKNLRKEIVRICYSFEDYNKWEERFIAIYKATEPEFGLNILKTSANANNGFGGANPATIPEIQEKIKESRKDYVMPEEIKEKHRQSTLRLWQDPAYIEKVLPKILKNVKSCHTDEVHKKVGESLKTSEKAIAQRKRIEGFRKGVLVTEETRNKISETMKNSEICQARIKDINVRKKGSKWYYKDNITKMIPEGQVIPQGFLPGRGKGK